MKNKIKEPLIVFLSCFAVLLTAGALAVYINSIRSYEMCSCSVMNG